MSESPVETLEKALGLHFISKMGLTSLPPGNQKVIRVLSRVLCAVQLVFLIIYVKYSSVSMSVPQFSKFLIKQKEVERREEGREMEFKSTTTSFPFCLISSPC